MTRRTLLRLLPIAALLVAAGLAFIFFKGGPVQPRYKTAAVEKGALAPSISANGTLNPVTLVNVGTQVSGTVQKLHADFNAEVKTGQVLAELDPALFRASLAQSEANLASARSNATLMEGKLRRARDLYQRKFISAEALDQAVQAHEAARAQEALARAQVERDRTNLRYSVIRSPISGVVVARNVDIGQTVAASFQTPTLFQIARDLREMQIDTSVAEADVGNLKPGLPVSFTVDAFPDATFKGVVKQVRLNPTIQQNVVTYNVVIAVDNEDGRLMPGMTAHVRISVGARDGVLRVPKEALRYRPGGEGDKPQGGTPGMAAGASGNGMKGKGGGKPGATVYVLRDGEPQAVAFRPGVSDAGFVEVLSGDLKEGDTVILREITEKKGKDTQKFQVRMF